MFDIVGYLNNCNMVYRYYDINSLCIARLTQQVT